MNNRTCEIISRKAFKKVMIFLLKTPQSKIMWRLWTCKVAKFIIWNNNKKIRFSSFKNFFKSSKFFFAILIEASKLIILYIIKNKVVAFLQIHVMVHIVSLVCTCINYYFLGLCKLISFWTPTYICLHITMEFPFTFCLGANDGALGLHFIKKLGIDKFFHLGYHLTN